MKSTARTKRSIRALRVRSCRSANWTGVPSAPVRWARSRRDFNEHTWQQYGATMKPMQTGSHTLQSETTAEALLELLAARGIDYFLAAGTGWGKSRKAAAAFAPQGWAAKAQDVPLCELGPSPA